jgi:hypothetical protein
MGTFFFFLAVLGAELKASCLLGRRFTAWATQPALSAVLIFEIGPHFTPGLVWTTILLFVLPHELEITGMSHHTQPLVEMGSCELLAWAGLEPQPSWCHLTQLGLQVGVTMLSLPLRTSAGAHLDKGESQVTILCGLFPAQDKDPCSKNGLVLSTSWFWCAPRPAAISSFVLLWVIYLWILFTLRILFIGVGWPPSYSLCPVSTLMEAIIIDLRTFNTMWRYNSRYTSCWEKSVSVSDREEGVCKHTLSNWQSCLKMKKSSVTISEVQR